MKLFFQVIVALFATQNVTAQEDGINELMDSLVREEGVCSIKTNLRNINAVTDTAWLFETRFYDKRGNLLESIVPGSYGKFDRRVSRYDSLNREISFIEFDKLDTTLFHIETKWNYVDSFNYTQARYVDGELVGYTGYFFEESADTSWLTIDERYIDSEYHNFQKTRQRVVDDSLEITEHIWYDDELILSSLDVYYKVKRDIDSGYLLLEGQYIVKDEEWDFLHKDREAMRDYYKHPDKYLQLQLDGAFAYEYGEDPFTYKVYNNENQLVQDGFSAFKTTFTYNELGQLTKAISWGPKEGEDRELYGIIKRNIYLYEYNEKGLLIKKTQENILRNNKRIEYYEYEYWE